MEASGLRLILSLHFAVGVERVDGVGTIRYLLLSQPNMTGSAGSLSLGERVGVRDFAHESGIAMQSPSPPAPGLRRGRLFFPREREPYRSR